jgi:dipeptidyl-peptidase 4
MKRLLIILLFFPMIVFAQNKQITIDDIYKKGTFRGEYVAHDFGKQKIQDPSFQTIFGKNGKSLGAPDDVIASPQDENVYLLLFENEPIYRRSSKSVVYLYNSATKEITQLDTAKIIHPQFSPDGKKIAYIKDNNLYIYNIAAKKAIAITTDGKWNRIINGNCDWVYEEEFEFSPAYQWSPKSNYIAYYRFDESTVREYEFTQYDNAYNKQYSYKYPKAGEANSKVEIHIYDVHTGKNVKAKFSPGDIYIPRIKWSAADNQLVVFWMNRHQDDLKLLLTNASSGASQLLYEEKGKCYVEINDDWYFLKDGKQFAFTSEKNGYRNLYMYGMNGIQNVQLTHNKYDIIAIDAIDEAHQLIYYSAAYPTPMDRNAFATDFSGKKTYLLTAGSGYHTIFINENYSQFYDYYSTLTTPQSVSLKELQFKDDNLTINTIQTISDNSRLQNTLKNYALGIPEFIRVPIAQGDTLNGWMLRPANFDSSKKYPVLFCNYGGPGSQEVLNRYGSVSMWHQLLAQKGVIIVSIDNTGTGNRGEAFKKKTYLQLGKYEIEDQIAAAKWMGQFPYVDKNHIGHWGWSFGGFMSALAITKGADVFSAAVAVAPVTNWRFYDNIYTERYMRTPQENPDGYDKNSPIFFTDKIKGKFLMIHGTADDNVHFQNATQMVTALVKSNIPFESAYYPNKNHGIYGREDNTTIHLWTKMTNWVLQNLGNAGTDKTVLK